MVAKTAAVRRFVLHLDTVSGWQNDSGQNNHKCSACANVLPLLTVRTAAITSLFVHEVSEQAACNSLMTYDKDILLPLKFHNNWLQTGHQVLV